ncbi:hypothetical protein BC937DRAFT_88730 [Endogone sp. FLAS-F59071]|nr:hypothetical protein BC937DRAFT_88730 [Endogone sp. FLAS-F59071]|eukprot:RUS18475.1 hypothetical protein BC937DRAFT_88730 [Endogone sp. FLAS-F59071]
MDLEHEIIEASTSDATTGRNQKVKWEKVDHLQEWNDERDPKEVVATLEHLWAVNNGGKEAGPYIPCWVEDDALERNAPSKYNDNQADENGGKVGIARVDARLARASNGTDTTVEFIDSGVVCYVDENGTQKGTSYLGDDVSGNFAPGKTFEDGEAHSEGWGNVTTTNGCRKIK